MQKVTAIVPIKRNSERIPGKNFVDFGGKPLYRHVLETLQGVEAVSCILVDTDCRDVLGELEGFGRREEPGEMEGLGKREGLGELEGLGRLERLEEMEGLGKREVLEERQGLGRREDLGEREEQGRLEGSGKMERLRQLERQGRLEGLGRRGELGELKGLGKVVLLDRPERLHGDGVVMNELLEAILEGREEEHFLQTHVTNPFLTAATIEACIASYFAHLDSHDSLFTVQRIQKRVYDAAGRAINHDLAEMKMTQDLPPIFVENSNLFLFSRSSYYANGKNRLGKRPLLHEMDALEGLDIDEPADLELARVLFSRMSQDRR